MYPAPRIFPSGPQQSQQIDISQQLTAQQPAITTPPSPMDKLNVAIGAGKGRTIQRFIIPAIILTLIVLIYFVWNPPAPTPVSSGSIITPQNFSSTTTTSTYTNSSTSNSTYGDIQVYITGAVKHPGVYTLPADARVYQLLKAAGGTQPQANLVAINLAAKLTDGEEVYVTVVGEVPPTYMGGVPGTANGTSPGSNTTGLVNINTATVSQLEQQLHVSSTTANNIVNYRTQNGPYTSIDQLLQVISTSIFNRIKNMVTV